MYGTIASLAKIGVWVNGMAYQEINGTSSNLQQTSVTLPTGSKLVEILSGPQTSGTGYPPAGAYVRAVYVPKNSRTSLASMQQGPRRLLIYSDSIATGQSGAAPTMQAWPLVVRQQFPGSVMLDAWGSRSLYQDYNASGALATLVARFARANPTDIWITIGTNDYGLNLWTAANFGTQYAALVDLIHATMPNVKIWCQTPISRGTETANGLGSTLPDYRSQISTAVSSRTAYCTLVDGTSTIAASDLSGDGIHPNSVGQIRYGRSVLTTLGFTQ
jgi:lysophospholipase L1-like esterase